MPPPPPPLPFPSPRASCPHLAAPEPNHSANFTLSRRWWFALGREPLLSAAELWALWPAARPTLTPHPPTLRRSGAGSAFTPPFARLTLSDNDPAAWLRRLGGTVKIGEELATNLSGAALLERMLAELRPLPGKIVFGISWYQSGPGESRPAEPAKDKRPGLVNQWGKEIKKTLRAQGRSARYIFKNEAVLSSVTVQANHLVGRGREFLVTQTTRINDEDCADSRTTSLPPLSKGRLGGVAEAGAAESTENSYLYALAVTRAIQPFAAWSARDYGRPARNDRAGMLPPKLARIMLNLAAASLPPLTKGGQGGAAESSAADLYNKTILDPFCGSGTILTEAALLGYKNIIGADISDKAIADTTQNIKWQFTHPSFARSTSSERPEQLSQGAKEGARGGLAVPQIFQSDIRNLPKKLSPASVDAIITEPYLGPPLKGNEKLEAVKQTALELNRLYFQAFREFKAVLRPGGTVVFIFPRFLLSPPLREPALSGAKEGVRGGESSPTWLTISPRVVPDIEKLGFKIDPLLPKELHPDPFIIYHRPGQRVGREVWRFRLGA